MQVAVQKVAVDRVAVVTVTAGWLTPGLFVMEELVTLPYFTAERFCAVLLSGCQ